MRVVVFCNHQAAAGFLVQAMHDARPGHAAHAAEAGATMVQQRVDQGVLRMARARMHDQSRRFVEHEQILVFVKNIQGHFLGGCLRGRRLRPLDVDQFSLARMMRRLDDPAIDTNMPLGQQALNGGARRIGKLGT